ncbi:MAG: hypothetical protein CMH27_08540 [Micavibrio sp.]|nr:hypothetical protein [Micavibrio sp.]
MLNRRQFLLGAGAGLLTLASSRAFGQPNYYEEPPTVVPTTTYFHPTLATNSNEDIGMAIVCAIDISGSIEDRTGEYRAQLESLANAIASDDFRESIFYPGGPQSIALCVVDFDHRSELVIPWVDFRDDDRTKFLRFSQEILNIQRRGTGGTEHASAMENAGYCFQNLATRWKSEHNSLNILTDGTSSTVKVREWNKILAEHHEATVYALTTKTDYGNLNYWAERALITPPNTYIKKNGRPLSGGFVHEVATERQTQINNTRGNAGGMAAYQDEVLLAMRRQVIMQTASLDIQDPYQCQQFQCRQFAAMRNVNKQYPSPELGA